MAMETTRFAVGPRGTERQALTTSSGTDVSYPLYDAHGNAFASIRRDASNPGGYVPLTASDVRAFDPWGNGIVSTGNSTGFGMPESGRPVQAYVGSLGHRKDDETGLIYMRARYYDPQVGRFTSEDPAMDGVNWFAYCDNDPVNLVDESGKDATTPASIIMVANAIVVMMTRAVEAVQGEGGLAKIRLIARLKAQIDRLASFCRYASLMNEMAEDAAIANAEENMKQGELGAQTVAEETAMIRGGGATWMGSKAAAQLAIKQLEAMIEMLGGFP
ncbi:hypothetical protein EON82_17060 [bacterium]|nr:MAG: hypothetical protein EON82_17060 [bacterium]